MMRLSRKLVVLSLVQFILCMGTLCSGAGADESERNWLMYMRGRDGTEYFYDKGAVIETPEGYLQVWRKRVFRPGAAQKEIVTFDQLSCGGQEEYRSLQLSVTYWDGKTEVFSRISPWAHIYTNSPEQFLVDEHCSSKWRRPTGGK